jgi:hypothetical protein
MANLLCARPMLRRKQFAPSSDIPAAEPPQDCAGTSKAQLIETINATAHTYEQIPGLIRKYYGIAPDGGSLVGIYLWESVAAANAFYTPDWVAMVTKRWAGPPQRQEWETPMVVESAERRLVAAE